MDKAKRDEIRARAAADGLALRLSYADTLDLLADNERLEGEVERLQVSYEMVRREAGHLSAANAKLVEMLHGIFEAHAAAMTTRDLYVVLERITDAQNALGWTRD